MKPEDFIAQIASTVLAGVDAALNKPKPSQQYTVVRQTQAGPVTQQTSLPQALAELTDQMKIANELKRYELSLMQKVGQVTEDLKIELEQSRKLAKKMAKQSAKEEEDDG